MSTKITFGRFKGKQFMEVLPEKAYCDWIISVGPRAKGNLKQLQDYINKTRVRKPTPDLPDLRKLKIKEIEISSDSTEEIEPEIEEKQPPQVSKVNKKNVAQFLKKRKDDLTASKIQNFNEDLTASTFFEMEI